MANAWALILLILLSLLGLVVYLALHYSVRPGGKPGGVEDPLRRSFLKYSLLASLALVMGQAWVGIADMFKSLIAPVEVEPVYIAKVDEIQPGTAVTFMMPVDPEMLPSEHPCILIRLTPELAEKAGTEFRAYSARCTHLGCIVEYLEIDGYQIYCSCHAGFFDPTTGYPISGPPKKPLPEVELEIREDGSIYAVGWVSQSE